MSRVGSTTLLALLVALVTVGVYFPSLGYGFVFDDGPLVVHNVAIRDYSRIPELFRRDLDAVWRSSDETQSNYYRPLFYVFLTALHPWAGDSPMRWHLAVVALHALVSVLALAFLRSHGHGPTASLLGALLFALHPVHVDSVAWVSGMQDVLLGLAGLAGALAYRSWRRQGGVLRLVSLGAASAACLLAKEAGIGLFLFVAGEWGLSRLGLLRRDGERIAGAAAAGLAVLALTYLALRVAVLGFVARPFPTAPGPGLALASLPLVVVTYLRYLLVPIGLSLLSPVRPVTAAASPLALWGYAAFTLAAVAAAAWVRRDRAALHPLLWFAAWLLPCLNLWAVNPEWIVMDRYLYLPALSLAWAFVGAAPVSRFSTMRVAGGIVLVAVFAGLSSMEMRAFRDETTFWRTAAEADPGSATAWTELGRLSLEAGRPAEARVALERAVALDPAGLLPRLRLGNLRLREGKAQEAAAIFQALVAASPGYAPAWRNLTVALDAAGRRDKALETARSAAARFPRDVAMLSAAAVLCRNLGRLEESIRFLRSARAVDPANPTVSLRLSLALAEAGRRDEAREIAARALTLATDEAERARFQTLLRQLDAP